MMKKKYYDEKSRFLILLTLLVLTISCKKSDNEGVKDLYNSTSVCFYVNGEPLIVDLFDADGRSFNLVTLNTEYNAEIKARPGGYLKSFSIKGMDSNGRLKIDSISENNKIPVSYTTIKGDEGTFYLNTLNSNIPVMQATGRSVSDGDFYLSFVILRLIMKVDNDGNIL